jgi:PAS domain S-box-containing protein
MKRNLKILHLEDLLTDAELIEREMRKAGLQFDVLLAVNRKQFLEALAEFEADIILSDHSLPDIDSREALKLNKQQPKTVPFILVTATVSEEYAVEIMKEGAYDYVLKDRMQRLPKAIENAIEKWTFENERQKYLEQTVASEARYRQIVETAQEGIWQVDHEFRTVFVNQKMCEILEYPAEEMLGKENLHFMNDEGKEIAKSRRQKRQQGIGENFDISLITKSGKCIWANLSTSAIVDQNGIFMGALAMVTDITNKKIAEEKLRQERYLLRALIDNLPDSIFVKDLQSRYLVNNKANMQFLGVASENESFGKTVAEILPGPQSQQFVQDDKEIFKSGTPLVNKEELITDHNGQDHWLLTTKIPLKDETGRITGLIGISRDITERKQIIEKLAVNEKRFRALVENISDGIVVNDRDSNLIYQSPSVTRILGYTESERKNTSLRRYVHPDYLNAYDELYNELEKKPGQPMPFLYPFLHKNGNYIWLEGLVTNLLHDPSVKAFVANYRDVNDRRKTEEVLRQSEANLRAIFDNTSDGFVLLDQEYKIIDYNNAAVQLMMIQNPNGSGRGKSIFQFISKERQDIFMSYLNKAKRGEVVQYEVKYTFGVVTKWLYANMTTVTTKQNELIGYCLTVHDYSEQKKSEQINRANEERFRALVENTDDIIAIVSQEGKINYVSPSCARILGYEREELNELGKGLLVHPEDIDQFDHFVSELLANPEVLIKVTFRAKQKSGHWRWLQGSANNLTAMASINGFVTNLRDVTNQKLLEEDLQQKKYFLEKAQESAKVGYWISGVPLLKASLTWSKETCRIFGLEESEFDDKIETFIEFIYPEDRSKLFEQTEKALNGESEYSVDYRIVLKNGSIRWIHQQAEVVRDERGRAYNMIGTVQDITERKVIEDVLRQYNERYELLSKATNDAIWDWDVKLKLVTWNHGLQTIFGYLENEVELTFAWWQKSIHPEDEADAVGSIHKVFESRQNNWSYTYRFRAADGRYKYVYDRAYVTYDEDFKPLRMIGAMQDITERMQALEEIKKLSFVASKTDNAVMIMDAAQSIEWVNDSFVKMSGYTLEELKGHKSNLLQGAETDAAMATWMNSKMQRGESFTGELVNYSKSGRKYWLKIEVTPVFGDDGKLKNFISIQSDITQQKEFEGKITAIARELASLIENANVPIFGIDRNGYLNEWNKVSEEVSGISKSELIGKRWLDELVEPDNRQAAEQMIAHVLHGKPVGNFELPMYTKAKKRLILLLSASPRRDAEKVINGAILVAQDITELIEYRRNLEKMVQDRTRELNEALQKEKELVNMKSKFVSIASHEFRTPLSTITLATGFIKKFKQKIKPEEIDDKLINIEKQVGHMTHLLDDVLMIGKVEAGKIPVRLSKINILEFFERLCKEIEQSTGKTHQIRLTHHLQLSTMLSDEKLLRNIVINTLTNAIKFSPGAQFVDVTLRSDADKFAFHVRDYGIGIPAEDMKQLFEPFHRGSNVNSIQGTGLGLSIIEKAVDLFQGFIDVKSEVGKGTELNIILPALHG